MKVPYLAFAATMCLTSAALSQPISGIALKDSALEFGPGNRPGEETRRAANQLRQHIGKGGEAEFDGNGLKWFRGKVKLTSLEHGKKASFESIKAFIEGDASFVGFSGELEQGREHPQRNGQTLHRVKRSQVGIPYYAGEFVVVSDDDGLTEFYGTPVAGPKSIHYRVDENGARLRALSSQRTSKRVIQVSRTLFNPRLLDQGAENKTVPAWQVLLDEGDLTPETIVVVDGESGAVLHVEALSNDALSRSVWTGIDPFGGTFGAAARSEGGAASSNATVNSEYGWMGTWYNTFLKYNRDGGDGNGLPMWAFVNVPSTTYFSCPNASNGPMTFTSNGVEIQVNVTRFCPDMAVDDVSHHEWNHSLVRGTANFTTSSNVGSGLHEGFADAFACIIAEDWVQGDQLAANLRRYPANPSADGHSINTWSSYTSSIDGHYLAGLISHPAYLMVNGGAGAGTDVLKGSGYEITKDLFYETLLRLTTNSSFPDFASMLVAQAKAGFSYGPRSTACDALMAVRSVGLDAGISTDACTDNRKNLVVLMTN